MGKMPHQRLRRTSGAALRHQLLALGGGELAGPMITLDDDLTDRGVGCLFGSGQSVTGGRGGERRKIDKLCVLFNTSYAWCGYSS